jgi:uncharacterized membrane protein YgcG
VARPLQFLDIETSLSADTGNTSNQIPLTVGSNFEQGDLRIVMVMISDTNSFSSFPGWTKSVDSDITAQTTRIGVFRQVLTGTSVDTTLTMAAAPPLVWYWAITIRNANLSQTIAISTGNGSGLTATAPSVSVTAGGANLVYVLSAFTAVNQSVGTAPGYTSLGSAVGTTGTNTWALGFSGKSFTTSGSSGTVPTPESISASGWIACSMSIQQAPDIASTLTPALETDTGVAVTSAMLPSTTNIITPALETDTGVEIYNPLRAVSIRPPVYLTGNPVTASKVSWSASTPAAGSAVLVETSLDNGASWQTALNGGAVPGLSRGDTTTPVVLTRATMTRLLSTDTSPFFIWLRTDVSVDISYNELVSLGVFLITQVDITETGGPSGTGTSGGGSGNGVTGTGGSSVGGGLSLTVSGIDLSYAISRNTWSDIYYVEADTNYATAALEIAQNRLPGVTGDVSSTEVTAERLLFGTSQGADAWQDLQDMGTAIGYEAYFDPVATFRFKAIADPALTPSVWTVSDAANPVMVSYTRSISDSTTYNNVVVSGESTSNEAPVTATATDLDPSSPTYALGPYNIVTTYFISAMITTQAQAQQAADALLLVVKGASETVEISMVPNPALEPGDVITVTRTFNGQKIIQGTFLINSISTPLAQSQAQTLVCYRQSAAQG